MKSILILVLSDLKHDARVRRQIDALKDQYALTVACFGGERSHQYETVILPPFRLTLLRKVFSSLFLLTRSYAAAYRILHHYHDFIQETFRGKNFDLIVANDVETLPAAFGISNRENILFDAHEYAPRHFEDKFMWRIFFQGFNMWLCRKYIPRVAGMTTVGKKLAQEYEKHFQVRPTVITNAGPYVGIDPSPVAEKRIRLVHHGIATASRNLHLMIEMMAMLDDRFTLDMYLLTPGFASKKTSAYIDTLKNQASADARITIHPPVSGNQLVTTINQYDIGVFLLPPVNFNYQNTLPNKLFDFIQARLAIAIGPTPEMAEIVREYENGMVSEDFTPAGLARKLNPLTKPDIETFKKNSGRAAKELNAENNKRIIQRLVIETLEKISSRRQPS